VPGARDNFATSHVGGLSYEKWITEHAGPQARHDKPLEAEALNSANIQFRKEVKGIVPGYSAHRPGAAEEYGGSAYGGVPPFNGPDAGVLGQGTRFEEKPDPTMPPSFRKEVNGVVPGYTGFVPNKHTKFGESHWGGVSGRATGEAQGKDWTVARTKGDKVLEVTARVKPGYSGHVPGSRDSFGTSTTTTFDFEQY